MTIAENGNTVSVNYKGTLNDGTVFDNSYDRGEPITFEVGSGQMISGFDSAILGMQEGETKSFTVSCADAYGERVEKNVQNIPRQAFPPDFKFVEGATVQGNQPDGRQFLAKIVSQTDEAVMLDFNHPLAGQDLNFEIELMNLLKPL